MRHKRGKTLVVNSIKFNIKFGLGSAPAPAPAQPNPATLLLNQKNHKPN